MANYVLKVLLPNNKSRTIPISRLFAVPAEQDARYVLLDQSNMQPAENVSMQRKGENLLIEVQHQPVVYINRFYSPSLQVQLMNDAVSSPTVAQSTSSTSVEPQPSVDRTERADSSSSKWNMPSFGGGNTLLLGGAALGGLALLAAAGGKKNSDSSTPNNSGPASTVSGVVVAGPVTSSNDLKVQLTKADGTELANVKVGSDGKFTATIGSYTGILFAKAYSTGSALDYTDETTKGDKNLSTDLWSSTVVSTAGSTVFVNVNPLTSIATAKVKELASKDLTNTNVSNINQAVATAYNVSDLQLTNIKLVTDSAFNGNDGLDNAERYGAILAALSGADSKNSGNPQTTIDNIKAGLVISGNSATITSTAEIELLNGATAYNNASGVKPFSAATLDVSAPTFSSAATASIDDNSGANQVVYQAKASDYGSITYSLKATGDASAFNINAQTGAVSIIANPDAKTKDSYNITVVATDSASHSAEKAVTLSILDKIPPTFTSSATANTVNEKTGSNQTVYTAVANDNAGSVSYSLKAGSGDATSFDINTTTGVVTLKDNPDYSQHPQYQFTVVASDPSGNQKELTVTLPVKGETGAPSVTEVALTGATGISNGYLGAGDEITATVSMNAVTIVTGTPTLALNIGGTNKTASYRSGSGSKSLTFSYLLDKGLTDSDGISIDANSLSAAEGVSLKDAAGTGASLSHAAVAANTNYKVDSVMPSIKLVTPMSQQLQSSDDGQAGVYRQDITPQAVDGTTQPTLVWLAQNSNGKYTLQTQKMTTDGSLSSTVNSLDKNSATSTHFGNTAQLAKLNNDGSFVATWSQSTTTSWVREIYVQRFDGNGNTLGEAYKVNANNGAASGIDGQPQVSAIGSDGSYVVVWDGYTATLSNATDLKPRRIYVQRFDKDGNPAGSVTELSVLTTAVQSDFTPSVVNLGTTGAFAVAWKGREGSQGESIFVQNFNASGQVNGTVIKLGVPDSSLTTQHNSDPMLSPLSDGSFVATWSGQFSNSNQFREVLVQKFNTSGQAATTSPIVLKTSQTNSDSDPSVADLGSGKFVVVWQGNNSSGGKSIFLQLFKADGTAATTTPTQLDVNDTAAINAANSQPDVVALTGGGYVVAWSGKDSVSNNGDKSIYLQQFNADGSTTGFKQVMLEANNMATGTDEQPELTALSNGGYLLSWQGQDRSGTNGAYVQQFNADGSLVNISSQSKITSQNEAFSVQSSKLGEIYLVNEQQAINNASNLSSLSDATLFSRASVNQINTPTDLSLTNLKSGSYTLYAVDGVENLDKWSQKVTLSAVKSAEITGAIGDTNGVLATGKILQASVTLQGEATVTSSAENPLKLDLNVGGKIVSADYKSSSVVSGNTVILFEYTVKAGDNDSNGVAIMGDSLRGGSILQNSAEISRPFVYVPDNKIYTIDGEAPIAQALGSNTVGRGDSLSIKSPEDGSVYLVSNSITFGNVSQFSTLNNTQALKVDVIGGINESFNTSTLALGKYKLYATDSIGNLSAASTEDIVVQPKATVVFDLVEGVSSSHSNRTFDANTTYTIYVRVNSTANTLSTDGVGPKAGSTWGSWLGAENLGSDDKITLIGNGSDIQDKAQKAVSNTAIHGGGNYYWLASNQTPPASFAAKLTANGSLLRQWDNKTGKVDLWNGKWSKQNTNSQLKWADVYLKNMPNGVLTSQGLA